MLEDELEHAEYMDSIPETTYDQMLEGEARHDAEWQVFVQAANDSLLDFQDGEVIAPSGYGISSFCSLSETIEYLQCHYFPDSTLSDVGMMFKKKQKC